MFFANETLRRQPRLFILEHVVEVPVLAVVEAWSPVDDPALWPPPVRDVAGDAPDVAPPHEPDLGVELGVERVARDAVAEVPPVVPQPEVEHRSRALPAVERAVLRRDRHEIRRCRGSEAEAAVNAFQPAIAVEELAVGHDDADVRLGIQIVSDAGGDRVRGSCQKRCPPGHRPSRAPRRWQRAVPAWSCRPSR